MNISLLIIDAIEIFTFFLLGFLDCLVVFFCCAVAGLYLLYGLLVWALIRRFLLFCLILWWLWGVSCLLCCWVCGVVGGQKWGSKNREKWFSGMGVLQN